MPIALGAWLPVFVLKRVETVAHEMKSTAKFGTSCSADFGTNEKWVKEAVDIVKVNTCHFDCFTASRSNRSQCDCVIKTNRNMCEFSCVMSRCTDKSRYCF